MHKKLTTLILLLLAYSCICIIIYTKYNNRIIKNNESQKLAETSKKNSLIEKIIDNITEEPVGKLIIRKINLSQNLYSINSELNNIDKNVKILEYSEEPSIKNTSLFIAAHSGTGPTAYFEELDKLSINDQIILEYKNNIYTYIVTNMWEEKKTGTITVPKEKTNQLILTTCHPQKDNYQLIINCIIQK